MADSVGTEVSGGYWDNYYRAKNRDGKLHELIGIYQGWDADAIFICAYNAANLRGGNIANSMSRRVHIGKPERLTVNLENGNVGVGTTSPSSRLHVNGDLQIDGNLKIKNWQMSVPDYVFEKEYALRPLSEVEAYVNEHHHLPEVPSAKTIGEEGVNLNEFCMTLLKKVEELSLYVIAQQKEIDALRHNVETK